MTRYLLSVPLAFVLFLTPLFPVSAAMPSRDLYLGARGPEVTGLQQYLIENGYGGAADALRKAGATGYFGPVTRAAVIEFQKAKGIGPAHGYVGPKTRAAMSVSVKYAPTFSGEIEAVDTGCFADGICSVTVDGKEVIVLAGFRMDPPPVGKLIGVASIGDIEKMIGATVHVYATTTTEGGADYTLYGSPHYYLEVEKKFEGTPITVEGTVGCLPPKDTTKPVIMMCAFGLKTKDGTYYALTDKSARIGAFDGEKTVRIEGTFVEGEHATWASIGTIDVAKVRKVK